MNDVDALIAVLAYERCQALADRSRDPIIRELWQQDAEAAWDRVQQWKDEAATPMAGELVRNQRAR